jgi:hypothetical protein
MKIDRDAKTSIVCENAVSAYSFSAVWPSVSPFPASFKWKSIILCMLMLKTMPRNMYPSCKNLMDMVTEAKKNAEAAVLRGCLSLASFQQKCSWQIVDAVFGIRTLISFI